VITAPEELDALPLGSVVAFISTMHRNVPICVVFQRGSNNGPGDGWTTPEAEGQIPSAAVFEFIALNGFEPRFTVLYNPWPAA
jgi:hypothetical protein